MRGLVRKGGIEAFSIAERLDNGHLDVVAVIAIEGAVAAITDIGFARVKNASACAIRSTGVVFTTGLP
jgi:hypothetical protein